MSILVTCHKCKQEHTLSAAVAEKNAAFKCRRCKTKIKVPKAKKGGSSTSTSGFSGGFSIMKKLLLILSLVGFIPVAMCSYVMIKQDEEQTRQATSTSLQYEANDLESKLEMWVTSQRDLLLSYANLTRMQAMSESQQELLLQNLKATYPLADSFYTLNPRGQVVARSDHKELLDEATREYFKDVAGGKDFAWQTVTGKISGAPELVLAVPIYSQSAHVGTLAASYLVSDLSASLDTWKRSQVGEAYIVDESDVLVAHTDIDYATERRVMTNSPLIDAFATDSVDHDMEFVENSKQHHGIIHGVDYGWKVVVQYDETEAADYADIAIDRGNVFMTVHEFIALVAGAASLVVLCTALLVANMITTPIAQIITFARELTVGNFDADLRLESNDEFSQLADHLTKMKMALKIAISRLSSLND